ncbi:hypothetical protein CYLTODRAFT_459675 [Cylindrobasidium torrendii FP15055 ss-10]|uniref:Uncharacterized protein n=1 Tax=Cylindrobasidium torrendii FP15055 ss-10 TaxID=1314674 RepID=A0A0D7AUI0_9AGAR|nr:hypothetical protein CYLTODRAFT_459675 [Cylindrobasidium torrendii FP15055 ss-10]
MEVATCALPPTTKGISGDDPLTEIPYHMRMRRTYDLLKLLRKYGLDFEAVQRLNNLPIGPNSIPPTVKASYQLLPYETAPVLKGTAKYERLGNLRSNIIEKSVMGERCSIFFRHVVCDVGFWISITETAPRTLHRVDRLAGTMPGTTNPNHRDNLFMTDCGFHSAWASGNVVLLAITSPTDFRPPKRLRDITKHNIRCAPKDRINIYDWIPSTDASTSPGQLYLAIFFDRRTDLMTLWDYETGRSHDAPVADGVLTFMNNHPLLVSFGSALNREWLVKSNKWKSFSEKQKPEIRGALRHFDALVEGWVSADIIETRAEYNAGMNAPRTNAPQPALAETMRQAKDTDAPTVRNTRSNAAADAEAAADFQAPLDRPRMTRSMSAPNLKQTSNAQITRGKSVKTLRKNLKRAADDEDEGSNKAAASTSRPMAKKTRNRQ